MSPEQLISIAWMAYALFMGALIGLPLASLLAMFVVDRSKNKSGAASPARRISSTDPANGDPGEAHT